MAPASLRPFHPRQRRRLLGVGWWKAKLLRRLSLSRRLGCYDMIGAIGWEMGAQPIELASFASSFLPLGENCYTSSALRQGNKHTTHRAVGTSTHQSPAAPCSTDCCSLDGVRTAPGGPEPSRARPRPVLRACVKHNAGAQDVKCWCAAHVRASNQTERLVRGSLRSVSFPGGPRRNIKHESWRLFRARRLRLYCICTGRTSVSSKHPPVRGSRRLALARALPPSLVWGRPVALAPRPQARGRKPPSRRFCVKRLGERTCTRDARPLALARKGCTTCAWLVATPCFASPCRGPGRAQHQIRASLHSHASILTRFYGPTLIGVASVILVCNSSFVKRNDQGHQLVGVVLLLELPPCPPNRRDGCDKRRREVVAHRHMSLGLRGLSSKRVRISRTRWSSIWKYSESPSCLQRYPSQGFAGP